MIFDETEPPAQQYTQQQMPFGPPQPQYQPPPYQTPQYTGQREKKPRLWLFILLGSVLIVGIAAFILWYTGVFGRLFSPNGGAGNNSAFDLNTYDWNSADENISLRKTFTSDADGFSFRYPDDWEVSDAAEIGAVAWISNATGSGPYNPNLYVMKDLANDDLFDYVKADFREMLSQNLDNIDIIKLTNISLDGVPARKVIFSAEISNLPIVGILYLYNLGDNFYDVECYTAQSALDRNIPVFNAIMDRYRITLTVAGSGQTAGAPVQSQAPASTVTAPASTSSAPSQEPSSQPPPPTPSPAQPSPPAPYIPYSLDDAIYNTNYWVRLTIYWSSGTTIFERDRDSLVWTMQSRDGNYRMVDAFFGYEGYAFTLGFPTTSTEYYLYGDGTGNFGSESLTWRYETDPSYTKGSLSNDYQVYDLDAVLGRVLLVNIYIYWASGETTIFYGQSDGTWLMKGRSGGLSSVEPGFTVNSNQVSIRFPTTTTQYVLYSGGSGTYGSENISWDYGYSSK